ncbi:hypothetical protein GCM10022263_03940 [Nocardioides daeguensis]|uniref:Uncharacterized protein n=1 Tax=Nocardioides daeguensis TaxID=908359 RepID=A0ABP6US59_9ACTN
MRNPSKKIPHQDAASRERPARPDQWLLDLDLGIEAVRWRMLGAVAGAPLMLGAEGLTTRGRR